MCSNHSNFDFSPKKLKGKSIKWRAEEKLKIAHTAKVMQGPVGEPAAIAGNFRCINVRPLIQPPGNIDMDKKNVDLSKGDDDLDKGHH